jgi:Lactonase, 7-bladed beta-propeller
VVIAAVGAGAAHAGLPRGALSQLDGAAGCLSADARQGCAHLRNVRSAEDLAISPDGRHVYVAGASSNTVVVLARRARTGTLVQLRGRAACVSARRRGGCVVARALREPSAIAISSDGLNVYVTESDDAIAVFARDRRSGQLTQLPGPAGCVARAPRNGCSVVPAVRGGRAVVGPGDHQVYVASAVHEAEAVVTLTRSPTDGALAPLAGPDGCTSRFGVAGCRPGFGLANPATVAFSPDGAFAYAPTRSGGVALFSRRAFDGALAQPAAPFGCVSARLPVAFCQRVRAVGGANDVVVSRDGHHVYVASFERGVAAFERDPITGRLAQLPGLDGCVSTAVSTACRRARGIHTDYGEGTERLVLSSDGRTLYAASSTPSGGVALLRRDRSSGALREMPGPFGCLGAPGLRCTGVRGLDGAQAIAISPGGRHAYVLGADFAVFARQR